MRSTALLTVVLALSATPALAQVTIDLRALDAVKPPASARPAQRPAAPPRKAAALPVPPIPPGDEGAVGSASASVPVTPTPAATDTAERRPPTPGVPASTATSPSPGAMASRPVASSATLPTSGPSAVTSAGVTPQLPTGQLPAPTAAPVPPPAATLPNSTPPVAMITPVAPPLPPANPPAAPQPPVSAAATTTAAPSGKGLTLTFGAGEVDLSPATVAAIKQFASTASGDSTTFNVTAYASGRSDDPSVSRRLSLSRALAVRSTLMAEGVASTRIYVRALGSQTSEGPPDRVDLSLFGANATAPR